VLFRFFKHTRNCASIRMLVIICCKYNCCDVNLYYRFLTVPNFLHVWGSIQNIPDSIWKFLTAVRLVLFIGMRFALMQVKTGLCHILSRFEVAPCKDIPERIVFDPKFFMLQNYGEIRLSFNRIQFWNNTRIYIYIDAKAILYIETSNCLINPTEPSPLPEASVLSASRKLLSTYITSSILTGFLNLPNSKITFVNLILNHFGKGCFRRNTNAALL
jgi:hypothetical protein